MTTKQAQGERQEIDRSIRVPLGSPQRKLDARIPEGKKGRWINDTGGRISDALRGGYYFITDTGDVAANNENLGSCISKSVGTQESGLPLEAYLMVIDEKLYAEDQREKQKIPDQVDKQILKGTVEQMAGDQRYIPSAGIKMNTSLQP